MTDFALPMPRETRSKTLGETLRAQMHVFHALVLHDIKSRYFGSGLGYIVTILWPTGHIAIIVIAHAVVHRELPFGDSALLYASTGVLPYIAFLYISRFTMVAAIGNKTFLKYPIITPLDLMIARQFLEMMTVIIITTGLVCVLLLCQADPLPQHPADAVLGLMSAVLLGMGFGIFNGVICLFFPMWLVGYILVTLSVYFTSGIILLNPEGLPAQYGEMLAWNPMLHSVEWIRSAYYDDYPHRLLDKFYVLNVGFTALVLGLVMERVVRQFT